MLPGFLGRAPWKAFDIEAFGFMLQLAQPDAAAAVSWLHPTLLGQADPNLALLPTWLGALFIRLAPVGMEALAARIPFMAMLGKKFPNAQFVITGVLGPNSNAHGPNEFLHVPYGKKLTASVAQVMAACP